MKKTYLKFNPAQTKFAPRMSGRRFRGLELGNSVAYLSDGGEAGDEGDSDEVKAIKTIGKQVEKFTAMLGEKADSDAIKTLTEQVKTLQDGIETMKADDVSALLKTINDSNEKLWKQVAEMQEEAAKAKEESEGPAKSKGRNVVQRKEVEDFIKTTFKDADGKEKSMTPARIAIKAAEIMGYSTFFDIDGTQIDAFTGRYVDPTLYQRKRKRNLILDNFTIRTINVPKLIYLIKIEDGSDVGSTSGDSGSAAWILSGEIKPLRSFRVTTGEATAKEVAIFGTVEDKLLRDVDSLERWIREDFMDEMREEINNGLLNNNPAIDAKAPLGLKTNAIQYTPTPAYNNAFTANSTNYIDQIFAINARMAYNKEEAGAVFVGSDVFYRIMHLKDSEGRYQNNNLVYTDALGRLFIGGTQVIMADEEDIPGTNVLAISRDLGFKIYAYGPMVFERGLNGEDFRYDRTSFRGYQEFLSFIPENRENSVLYDTWANVKAAIEA